MAQSLKIKLGLWAIVGLGLGLRVLFAEHQAFTNDEGAYLYDARLLLEGRLPGGDVLTKTPVTIVLFMVGEWLTGYSLYAARAVTVLASVATAWPLTFIGRALAGKYAGWLAAGLWLLGSGPIIFHSLGQTEAVAALLATGALALGIRAVSSANASPALLTGVILILAFAARKTSVAVLVPLAVVLWWAPLPVRDRWRVLGWGLAGAVLVLVPWLITVNQLYGAVGVGQALGVSYGQLSLGNLLGNEVVQSWGASIDWVVPTLARIAGSYLWLGVTGLAAAGMLLRRSFYTSRVAGSYRVLLPVVWLLAVGLLYAGWPTILPEYTADAFPALVLLGAVVLRQMLQQQRWIATGVLTGWLAINSWSLIDIYRRPWFGMFTAEAVTQAAQTLHEQVPLDEPVFTAAVIVPYRSGHRVWHDVAHPHWYRYDFIQPGILATFVPPREVMERTLTERAQWALVEHLTDYVYLRSDADLITFVHREWQQRATIPNHTGFRDNPLQLWQR